MSQDGERLSLLPESASDAARFLRFGVFELELASGELRRAGLLVKLRHQPAKVLAYLAARPGRVIAREELRAAVWDGGTYVDFDQGLNYCIKEIRSALSDSAETPLYVETLPRRGYRFIAPVEALGDSEDDGPAPAATAAPAAGPRPAHALAWVQAALTVAAVATAAWLALRPEPPAPPAPEWQRLTFRRGSLASARFAPGGQVLCSAAWEGGAPAIHVLTPGAPDARSLPLENVRLVSVSSAGDVAFIQERAGDTPVLARMPLAGGPVKALLDGVDQADGTADGAAFAVAHRVPGQGLQIEYPAGHRLMGVNAPSHLRLSPDGTRLAFIEHPRTGDDRGFVLVLDASGKVLAHSRTFASAEGLAWPPGGREVWFTAAEQGGSLALLALDAAGHERTVLPASGRLVLHDVGRDGRALLDRVVGRAEIAFVDALGAQRDLDWFDASHAVFLTADGGALLFSESGEAGGPGYGVYLRRTDGQPAVRLGSGVPGGLTPDGRYAVVVPLREPDHVELLPTGPGETRVLRFAGIVQYEWAGATPDGSRLVFVGGEEGHNLRVWVGGIAGGAARPLTPDGLIVSRDTMAPDGLTLFAPCAPRTFCLYPLDGGAPRPLPGLAGAVPVGWDPSGRFLYVRGGGAGPRVRVEKLDLRSGARSALTEVAPRDPVGVDAIGRLFWSRDGRAYAFNYSRRLSELYLADHLR